MLRGTVMSKFELQKRFTADSLLKLLGKEGLLAGQALLDGADGAAPAEIDQTSHAQKYCAMGSPPVCGEVASGSGYSARWTRGSCSVRSSGSARDALRGASGCSAAALLQAFDHAFDSGAE